MESGPAEAVCASRGTPIRWRCSRPARGRRAARRAARDHPRRAAGCARPSRGLPIRRPMRAHHRPLPHVAPPPVAFGASHVSRCHRAGEVGLARMSERAAARGRSLVKTYRSPGAACSRARSRLRSTASSFSMQQGRSFGIVGESGSGKSTLARIALALDRPIGVVRLQGRSLFDLPRGELRATRAHMQMVFQDPYGSLDPRQRVEKIVAEPLAALGGAGRAERRARVRPRSRRSASGLRRTSIRTSFPAASASASPSRGR